MINKSTLEGIYLRDSVPFLPAEFPTTFETIAFKCDSEGRSEGLASWGRTNGLVLSVAFIEDCRIAFSGTAVLVGPGIAIAALHVFSDRQESIVSKDTEVIVAGARGNRIEFWKPYAVTEIQGTDLLMISMDYSSPISPNHVFNGGCLTTRTPEIGETVTVLGYRPSRIEFHDDDSNEVQFGGALHFGSGKVTSLFPEGRDTVMLPWPVFEIECPSQGAMSGGPVFDIDGLVIGILSTSFTSEEGAGPSYASFLWDALDAPIQGGWRSLSHLKNPTSLRQLQGSSCEIVCANAVTPRGFDGAKSRFANCRPWN